MKKLLLLLSAFTLLFISCEEEEEVNTSLEGTWLLTSKTSNGEEWVLDDCELQSTAVFSENTFSMTNYIDVSIFNEETLIDTTEDCYALENIGSYSTLGNSITINYSLYEESYTKTKIYNVLGNTLTLSESYSETNFDEDLEEEVTETWTWTETYTRQ